MLLLHVNRPVRLEWIIDALWGNEPPATARQTVQYFVHRIRQLLAGAGSLESPGERVVVTTKDGYQLQATPEQVDADRFRQLADQASEARAAGDLTRAADAFTQALALWRGPALADFAEMPFAQAERARLEELRLQAIEDRAENALELGDQTGIEEELEALVRQHPWRERLQAFHLRALYRSGRQVEALAAYRAASQRFMDELGIEPGAELRRLEQEIRASDPAITARPRATDTAPDVAKHAATDTAANGTPAEPATAAPIPPALPSASDSGRTLDRGAGDQHSGDQGTGDQTDGRGTTTAPRSETDTGPTGQPAAATSVSAPSEPERKVITALVAGLVDTGTRPGDTEDHIAMHARMVQRVGQEVRRYGGDVHAVFGGTLLAVFGAARVREDDPERAVRAALAIAGFQDPAGLAVRVGAETGTAVVSPPAGLERPGGPGASGGSHVGGVTGVALDVASSLGVSAAPGSVLVGPAAHRATERLVEFELVRPGAWQPLAPRSRIGHAVVAAEPAAPLVERDRELTMLDKVLTRVREDREPQLVTLIGAPGIGKTRLVGEFARLVDEDPELITWRQARSVPYGEAGEGVTLWALAEIVRAQAGILDTDPSDLVAAKLHHAVAGVIPDAQRGTLVEQRLRPLVQVAALPAEADQRRQLIQGWAQLMEGIADHRPLVIVVEDLQWADRELLDCLDGLLDDVGPVPLLMICTARPELLEHRPGWGGGKRNAVTVTLTPLTDQGSGTLLDDLLARRGAAALPERTRARLLDSAGGIPLYLEEYVRMLRDRAPSTAAAAQPDLDLPLPETLQQIISARLDTLPAGDRRLLRDMAVLGEVGWRDPLAALTGAPPEEVDAGLARLARHELVRPVRSGRGGGRSEYAFRHALVRDVAYGQLLRAERADRHRRVAEWLAATRGGDHAEAVAHHYQRALTFLRAAGQPTRPLERPARLALRDAGDRACSLGALRTAIRLYDQALELWPHDDGDRADLLLRLGRTRAQSSATGETELRAARDLFEAAGESGRAAEASIQLGYVARLHGDLASSRAHNERAMRLAGSGPPSRPAVNVLIHIAGDLMLADRNEEAIRTSRQAIRSAAELGLAEVEATGYGVLGIARLKHGDSGGRHDLDRGLATLEALQDPNALLYTFSRVRGLWRYGDLAASADALAAARRTVDAFASDVHHLWLDLQDAMLAHAAGRWDDAVKLLDRWMEHAASQVLFTPLCLTLRGAIRLDRGDLAGAVHDAEAAQAAMLPDPYPEGEQPVLALHARTLLAAEHTDRAAERLDKLLADVASRPAQSVVTTDLVVALVDLDRPAGALPKELSPTRWHEAARAFAARDFPRAAGLYREIGTLADEALARLYGARQLASGGDHEAAASELAPAVTFWESVGADARLADARALLDRG